ncbi:hypothetical protein [Sedimentitalea arenosa]|uniref:Uncharacterized protein n=1 Tax=Sedimentitalea arenosa TaxID=2798803 RepID=A0A8J7J4C2_9RHOB|nr:hypothetical protein [Arenibacterium arenosum]MBJ6373555.1 hypothetical protein [Arenibacterium arenosum]
MGRLEKLRKFKRKWGYDDFHVGSGGKMEAFGVDDALRDRVAKTLFALDPGAAAKFRARFENPEAVNLDGLKALLEAISDQEELVREVGEVAERIRFNTASPTPDLIGRIAKALGSEHPKAEALKEWQDDLTRPYDPMQTELAVSILNRVRDRGTVDRTAAIDQVANRIYSTDRRQELVALTGGHYIAESYGLRTIKDMSDAPDMGGTANLSGIRNVHDESSVYQRDSLKSDLNDKLKKIYNDCKEGKDRPKVTYTGGDLPKLKKNKQEATFFVNSAKVDRRLDKIYTDQWVHPEDTALKFKANYIETVTLDQNIHVLLMKKQGLNDKQLQAFQHVLLSGSGSTPSAYAIERAESPSRATDLLSKPELLDDTAPPNDSALERIAKSKGATRLADLPDTHPMKQTALASAKMVSGMQDALSKLTDPKATQFKQNKLVKSALDKIERLMQVMPSYAEDTPRFSKLFDLLVDEVYLVLATCKPYSIDSYRETTDKVTEERIPILTRKDDMPKAQHKTFLVSTGMGAMSAAVEAAYARTGSRKLHLVDSNKKNSHSANYFEVEGHLIGESVTGDMTKKEAVAEEDYTPPVIMATLNPSTPTNPEVDTGKTAWTIEALIKNVGKVLTFHGERLRHESCTKPAVLVIDATVERDGSGEEQEMNQVVSAFAGEVNEGILEIIFIKSYQKYPSLGAGKAMAGGLTVIGNRPEAGEPFAGEPWASAQASETDENIMANDEAQIVTHFLTHESDVERKMLARAAKNASFVRSFLPGADVLPKDSPMAYDAGLPFIAMPNSNVAVGTSGQGDRLLDELLINQGVEPRMSFGFQNTSGLPTSPGMMRIGIGQESEAELVEKLYGTLMLATTGMSADHTKHDKDQVGYLPEGRATADSVRKVAGVATDKGFSQIAKGLSAERAPAAADKVAVARLLKAGLLQEEEVKRGEGGVIEVPDHETITEKTALLTGQVREMSAARKESQRTLSELRLSGEAEALAALLDQPVPQEERDLAAVESFGEDEEDKWRRKVGLCLLDNADLLPDLPALKWNDPQTQDHLVEPDTGELRRLLGLLAEARKADTTRRARSMLAGNAKLLRELAMPLPVGEVDPSLDLPKTTREAGEALDRLSPTLDPAEMKMRLAKIAESRGGAAREAALKALKAAPKGVFESGELDDLDVRSLADLQTLVARLDTAQGRTLRELAIAEPANAAWREKTITALLRAGVLKPDEIVRAEKAVLAPSDAELDAKMQEIASADATTPEGLRRKLAVVVSMRKVDIQVESLALSRQSFPRARVPKEESDRQAWRETIRRTLGSKAPAEEADDTEYLEALESAKTGWRLASVELLKANDRPPPKAPAPPKGDTGEELKAHARKMSDYDAELRLALAELDDATRMHGAIEAGFDLPEGTEIGVEAQFLPNIVASCASTQLAAMKDETAFCDLFDVLRDVGLDQLSNETRERLMDRRGKIALKGLKVDSSDEELEKLARIAESFPYGEGPGRLLTGTDLESLLKKPEAAPAPFAPDKILAIAKALTRGMSLTEIADALPGLVEKADKVEIKPTKKVKGQAASTTEQKALAQSVAVILKQRLDEAGARQKRDPSQAPVRNPNLFAGDQTPQREGLEPMTAEELEALRTGVRTQIETAIGFDVLPK